MEDQTKYLTKLRGKLVLIVGGSAGIGYAVAEAVLEHGGSVFISSSSQARVDKALKSLSTSYPSAVDRIFGHTCDMAEKSNLETNILRLLERTGKLDHIVYTAGDSVPPTPITEATYEKIQSAGTVRYAAPVLVAKFAPKYLRPGPQSSITLTTGVVVEKPIPNWSVIAGARSAVIGLGKALALDLKPTRVNVVCVGAVNTDIWSHFTPDQKSQMFEALMSKSATGRIADASDVAEAYVYCMKDKNVTGSVISTNGGVLLT